MFRKLTGLCAATFVVAAGAVLLPLSPASAAGCPGATGVTVVVDFHQLGGGIRTGCAATGGGKAASVNFPAAGFPLTYTQRSPGFVCRVSGKPTTDACVVTPPVNKYWSLWWSDGKTGKWSYSSLGVGALKVPTGGYLAFSWQGQAAKAAPGQAPTKRLALAAAPSASASASPAKPAEPAEPTKTPTPTKAPKPSNAPSQSASNSADKPDKTASAAPTPDETSLPARAESPPAAEGSQEADEESQKGDKELQKSSQSSSESPTASESAEPSDSPSAEAAAAVTSDPPSSGGSSGLPTWVTVSLLLALAGAIGGVAFVRGRRTTGVTPSP